ncbi:MAG: HAD-IIIA family hydrolase [Bacteroidales bacterium]|nr:HAD-IIIA family hydrolase [Bacteroidales bacterium]
MKKLKLSLKNLNIDKSWTLFLDRDGVINKLLPDDYVKNWDEFKFVGGSIDAIKTLSGIFGRTIIVTNQQGIGKGIMNENDLDDIHSKMLKEIENNNGKIDKIYFCPSIAEENSFLRKPNVGMALKARKEFPEINFRKSIIAGDTISDMKFGFKLKMIKVFLSENIDICRAYPQLVDFSFKDLKEFSIEL